MSAEENIDIPKILEWQKEQMKKHGFYIHGVEFDNVEYMDYHTHGLMESFNLPELQIVMPVSKEDAHKIIHTVVHELKRGNMKPNLGFEFLPYMVRLDNGSIAFFKFIQLSAPNDHMLRLILSDPMNRFRGDLMCDPLYAKQDEFNPEESDN